MTDGAAILTRGSKRIEDVKRKVLESSIRDTQFIEFVQSPRIPLKSHVARMIHPKLERINFYEGYRTSQHEYFPQLTVHSRLQREEQSQYRCSMKLKDVLNLVQQGHLTVVGPTGSGKTSLLKAIVRAVINGTEKSLTNVEMVHFLQGKNLCSEKQMSPVELLFHNANLDFEEADLYLRFVQENPSKVLFVIDSLDTLQYSLETNDKRIGIDGKGDAGVLLWNLLTGNLFPGCKIISSSREHTIRKYEGKLRAKTVVALVGFTNASIEKIVEWHFPDKTRAGEAMERLRDSPAMMSLSSVPLFLSHFLLAFETEPNFSPRTITGLLVSVLQFLVRSSHVHVKDIEEVIHKLKELAFQGTEEHRVQFSTKELRRYGLREEEVNDLIVHAAGGKFIEIESTLFFNHQSFQELLTAFYIAEMDSKSFKEFIEIKIHDPHYAVVRKILCGIMFNDEVTKTAYQFFKSLPDVEKRQILMNSMKKQLLRTEENDFLELVMSFNEAGAALNEALSKTLTNIDLRRMTLTPSDIHAVGSVISRCTQLQTVYLRYCNLDATLLQILNSRIKTSNVQIKTIDVRENQMMGADGMKNLAEIVERCGVERLTIAKCNLTPVEIFAFCNALRSPRLKMKYLALNENTSMEEEGLAAIGDIVKRCEMNYLGLDRCELKATEVEALRRSLEGSKIRRFNVNESDTYGKSQSLLPIAEICSLLPRILEELDLTGCELKPSDVEMLRNKLHELDMQELKIHYGPHTSPKVLSSRDSLRTPDESGNGEDDVQMDKYGSDFVEKTINSEEGGSLLMFGCGAHFRPNSLNSDCIVRIDIGNESSSVPEEYQTISPTLTLDVGGACLKKGGVVYGEITTWCYADTPIEVELLRRKDKTNGWERYESLCLGEDRRQLFEIRTLEYSEWVIAVRPSPYVRRVLKYRILAYLCQRNPSEYNLYYCIDDEFTLWRIEQYAESKGLACAILRRHPLVISIGDSIFHTVDFTDFRLVREITCRRGGFQFTGIFKSKCFMPDKIVFVPATGVGVGQRAAELRFAVSRNSKVIIEVNFHTELADVAEEFPAVVKTLRSQIDANTRTPTRKSGTSDSDGGVSMELCDCKLLYPPNALKQNAQMELAVSSQRSTLGVDGIALTPIFSCELFGALPAKPASVELPVHFLVDCIAVMYSERHSTEWKQMGNAVLNRQNWTIEIPEVPHFHRLAGFIQSGKAEEKRTVTLHQLMYNHYEKAMLIGITFIGGKKVEADCTNPLQNATPIDQTRDQSEACFGGPKNIKLNFGEQIVPSGRTTISVYDLLKRVYHINWVDLSKSLRYNSVICQEESHNDDASMLVEVASREFYEKHIGDETIYQIASRETKGKVLIINNFSNDPEAYRTGSEENVRKMCTLWQAIGLEVVLKKDMTAEQMMQEVTSFAQCIGEVSLCVVVVMSHGDEVCGADVIVCVDNQTVLMSDIFLEFDDARSPHLVGVPKIFLMECCRGDRVFGRDVPEAQPERRGRESPNNDRLIVYATERGCIAYLNEVDGSWFINAIYDVFRKNSHNMGVLDMMSLVNSNVSQRLEREQGGQQISPHHSTLQKLLYLFPGPL